MTTSSGISWNKIIVICSTFGIPFISFLIMCTVWATRIEGKQDAASKKQDITDARIDKMDAKIDRVIGRVDTIAINQHDYKIERDITEKMRLQQSRK